MKFDVIEHGEFVFVIESGHFVFRAAINQMDLFCAQPMRGGGGVDGGVAAADDHYAAAHADATLMVLYAAMNAARPRLPAEFRREYSGDAWSRGRRREK